MEPLLILLLAWALGAAIQVSAWQHFTYIHCLQHNYDTNLQLQDTHTNNYIAQVLKGGGVSMKYIPVIVTIIGFTLSFATGSVSNIKIDP